MNARAREWLPANVAENAQVFDKISGAVRLWSQTWFTGVSLHATSISAFPGAMPGADEEAPWRAASPSVAVRCSRGVRTRLAEWALGERLHDHGLNAVERQLLDRFEAKLIDDLSSTVGSVLGAGAKPAEPHHGGRFGGAGGVTVRIVDGGGDTGFSMAVDLELLRPLCRPLRAKRPAGSCPNTIADAIADIPVTIEATLGEAEVRLSDLRGLAPGDVLVLGAALSNPAPVYLTRGARIIGRARLTDVDGTTALVVQAPVV